MSMNKLFFLKFLSLVTYSLFCDVCDVLFDTCELKMSNQLNLKKKLRVTGKTFGQI